MTSTIMSTTISKLPDLALLEVFANVPLLDMFTTIPLVCTNWHRLQRPALLQRNRLYLVSMKMNHRFAFQKSFQWIRHLAEDVLGEPGIEVMADPKLNLCLTPSVHSDQVIAQCTSDAYLHNTLPLPAEAPTGAKAKRNGIDHMRALSSPETVRHLTKCLPNITELTVACNVTNAARIVRHITQLIRCYSPKLTVLRLYLPMYSSSRSSTDITRMKEIECLVCLINNNLPRLHSLQLLLGSVQLDNNIHLSASLLNQLRLFVINLGDYYGEYNQSQLLRSKHLNLISEQEHPDLVMIHRQIQGSVEQSPQRQQSVNASHVRFLAMRIDSVAHLCRVCAHFRHLTSLDIRMLEDYNDGDDDDEFGMLNDHDHVNAPMNELLPTLATLPALTRLSLGEVKDDQSPEPSEAVLPALRHLTLRLHHHANIKHYLLHTGSFPVLEHLHFPCLFCRDCHLLYGSENETACRHAMLPYLNTCPSLRSVRFGSSERFTRADATEEFRPNDAE